MKVVKIPQLFPIVAVSFLMMFTGRSAAQSVPNGGFESASGGMPDGWLNDQSKGGAVGGLYIQDGKEGDTVKTGKAAIKFQIKEGVSKCIWIMAPATSVAVDPGAKYALSYWVKRENFDQPGLRFMSECKGLSSQRTGEYVPLGRIMNLSGSSDWEKVETPVEVPADGSVTKLIIVFRLVSTGRGAGDGGNAQITVDDVTLAPQ